MEKSKLTLKIDRAKIENDNIVIEKLTVFDKLSGKTYRVAKINEHLLKLFKMLEIDVTQYQNIDKMVEKNPDLKLLISTFDLHSF